MLIHHEHRLLDRRFVYFAQRTPPMHEVALLGVSGINIYLPLYTKSDSDS